MTNEKNDASEKDPTPRFTGIFIPVEILNIEELSCSECFLLSWIDALYDEEHKGCFASNEYFMKKLKLKESTVRAHISKLVEMGLVERVSFDGRTRVIRACKEKWFDQTAQRSDRQKSSGLIAGKIAGRGPEKSHPPYIERKEDIKEDNNIVAPIGALSADADDLLSFFIQKLKERKSDIKLPDQNKWRQEIDRMIRIDKRDPKIIRLMIDWIHKDSFWSTTILSAKSLRNQYDRIELQMKSKSVLDDVQKNKAWAMRNKQKYQETYRGLTITEKFAIREGSGKEIPLNLPHENFKKSLVSMFGINWNDLSESDKK
jgi:DNA-binding transcriptional ArsR family regulator